MKASVIIAIYNNVRFLKPILDSLKHQTEKDFEIIIAEDGENPLVRQFIASYTFSNPFQHLTQKDEGWRKNRSLNNAIKFSKTDWLIFIDGDCLVHPRFVEMHLRYANENHILAGKRVKLDKETSTLLLEDDMKLNQLQKYLLKRLIIGKGTLRYVEEGIFISPDGLWCFIPKVRTLSHLTGSNMSFSKKAIYSINGFDEDYTLPAVGEDYDLTWRFRAKGYKHVSLRNLAIQYHLHHVENWTDQKQNMEMCRKKQNENSIICKNGLDKITY